MPKHIKDVVGCQVGDYTAIPAGRFHLSIPMMTGVSVTNGLGEFLNGGRERCSDGLPPHRFVGSLRKVVPSTVAE